ncbi:MAG: hypothetical protein WCY21_03435 [Candidatus Cloacimonadaceae bacterium]
MPDSSGTVFFHRDSAHHHSTLSLEEHRFQPVVGARFIWHNVLPITHLRHHNPAPKRHSERQRGIQPFRRENCSADHPNPELGGAPDSSGRGCQIHLAQCSSTQTPPTTTQTLSLEEHRIHLAQ